MYQFFTKPDLICGNDIYIEGLDVNHIKNVLRMRIGEEVNVVTEGSDLEYRCEIAEMSDDQVHLKLLFTKESNVELPAKVYLFQGLPKSDKMELIIQKVVELGVYEIVPVAMKRCVVKLDEKKEKSKIVRYNSISESAAKQSKRRIVPKVTNVMSFKEAVDYSKSLDVKLIPYELCDTDSFDKTREIFKSFADKVRESQSKTIGIFIGPEGGFSEEEIEYATGNLVVPVTLGKRILRTETAGMTVLSWLVYLLEN